ncbi:MAG: DUF6314 family protein [Rubricella sp.]
MLPQELARFQGRWRIDRTITDHAGGATGAFEGTGAFRPDGAGGLAYDEDGMLCFGGVPLRATRRYLYGAEGGRIFVAYEDGRPFHDFDAGSCCAWAEHLCGEDHYKVTYRFVEPDRWTADWVVRGPRKDYRMETRYARIA